MSVPWLDNAEVMIRWLSEPGGTVFEDSVKYLIELETRTLKNSDTLVELHRAQGRVQILDKLLKLKGDLSNAVGQKK